MSLVISVYAKEAFCDFLLPAVNNEDTQIILKKNIFLFKEDVSINLENVDGAWRIIESSTYKFKKKNGLHNKELCHDDIINVLTKNGEEISCIIRETNESFSVFKKYDISKRQELSIGSEFENDIQYQYLSLVSKQHAVLKRVERGFAIKDTSSNGTFVNAKRIDGSKALHVGDCINIFGLKIVYLGTILAISGGEGNIYRIDEKLQELIFVDDSELNATIEAKEKQYFHRAPRNYICPSTEEIEIEAPPTPKRMAKKPIWMLIGPSFTMMIPMLTGSVIAILSARSSGSNASVYMYTGIITAAGSALVGVYWALANLRFNKKEMAREEEQRIEAYEAYLQGREKEINGQYEKYSRNLNDLYPEAAKVAEYGDNSAELWNRNQKHKDFLSVRLGKGEYSFPLEISIPKDKFSVLADELADRPKQIKEKYSLLQDVPVNLELNENKLLGVVGGSRKKGAFEIIRALTTQIAANNCYTDVKLVFVHDGTKESEEWEYARWFPHVWSEDKKTRYVASNKSQASDIFFELLQIFRMRAEDEESKKVTLPKPYYVMIVSEPEFLEGELITKYIYEMAPCYGLTTLLLVENEEELPNNCENILKNNDEFCGLYNLNREETQSIQFDKISANEVERFARRILSIQVNERESGRDIPNSLTFFEMYGIRSLSEVNIAENWKKNRTYENMKAMVGFKAGGVPCYLDVHEKYHGPHGLVAGTTGSGKSETLQTYMLSLAMNFSPDDIGYFIIDYKGGGMAGLFDGLPHMIGAISNLSGSQVRRAMVSIKSENRRRQKLFSENNVNNINLYTKLYKSGEVKVPVPHMFIIVDEFAELKREEPEFMKELISVAQVGRSLGVHLILATQKPSGTVDDNIWSNSKFRLCLRVQDRQDSNDMLHKPDAAYITQAGRTYLQVGNDEVYELFQSGYSGAVYDEDTGNVKTEVARMISTTGRTSLIGNSLKRKQQESAKIAWIKRVLFVIYDAAVAEQETVSEYSRNENRIHRFFDYAAKNRLEYEFTESNARKVENLMKIAAGRIPESKEELTEDIVREIILIAERNRLKLPETKGKTQLDAVVEYLGKIAKQEGYGDQMKLWLPPLAKQICLTDLAEYKNEEFQGGVWKKQTGKWNLSVFAGLCDDPENQAQFSLPVSLTEGGHLAICGSIVSGKSTLLQTILFGLISKYQPDWVNVYVIDFSSHMLNSLVNAPHVGGVVFEDDEDKIAKFFYMMEHIIEERKKTFSGGNYAQYVQANGVVLPAIVIALDNIGAFREKTDGKYDDKILRLLKEGISYGIYLIVTAGGFSSAEITMKMADNIKTVVCLQMNDKFAYGDALRQNHFDVLPETNVKGRGLVVVGGKVLEFQAALALKAEDDFKRMEQIDTICRTMRDHWNGYGAKQIPMIPEKPAWEDYEKLAEVKQMDMEENLLPVGYEMSSAEIYGVSLEKLFTYLISGKLGTGKTNVQKALIRSASKKNGKVIVIEHSSAELKSTAKNVGAQYINTQEQQAEFFASLVSPMRERAMKKRALLEDGRSDSEVFTEMRKEEPYFVVIDDMAAFIASMNNLKEGVTDIRGFVENIAQKGKLYNIYFFIGVDQTNIGKVMGSKILEGFLSYRVGMHLGGSVESLNYMDFSNIPYVEKAKVQKAGIAMLPTGNGEECSKVVIPLVRG